MFLDSRASCESPVVRSGRLRDPRFARFVLWGSMGRLETQVHLGFRPVGAGSTCAGSTSADSTCAERVLTMAFEYAYRSICDGCRYCGWFGSADLGD